MTQTCKNCTQVFEITQDDLGFYQKMDVPAPLICPDCRYQLRLINRDEWTFYRRPCNLCKKDIVAVHNPDYPGPVYCRVCWWSDGWDALTYGRDIDFSRPFFEQYFELQKVVPRLALVHSNSPGSEYTNQAQNNKDSYLLIASDENERCLYGNWYNNSLECMDCYMIERCELLYECIFTDNSYRCAFLNDAGSCHDVYFSDDVVGCSSCFGCVALRGKSYCWFNEQLTKEEYEKRFKGVDWSQEGIKKIRAQLRDLRLRLPLDGFHGDFNMNSTGDYIDHNKDARHCFNCRHSKNIAYAQDSWTVFDCWDITENAYIENGYQLQGCIYCNRSIALRSCGTLNDSFYCDISMTGSDQFGCIGLRGKKHCIFNKQYSKEEYEVLKNKLIDHMKKTGEWGTYTPAKYTMFGYNESVAQEYFPLTKEQALAKGFTWYDRKEREYKITHKPSDLLKTIQETTDDILNAVIACESGYLNCATAYKITPNELMLYRKMNLPVPHKCFPCRRQDRFTLRNPRKLWKRTCAKCNAAIETSYAPERPEIVYCETCYNAAVV